MPLFTLPFPTINPVLIAFGPLAIRWYALSYIAGLILGWAMIRRILSAESLWRGAPRPSAPRGHAPLLYFAGAGLRGGPPPAVLFFDPPHFLFPPPPKVYIF